MGFLGTVWNSLKDAAEDTWDKVGKNPFYATGIGLDQVFLNYGTGHLFSAAWKDIKMLMPDMRRDREMMLQGATDARVIVYGRTRVSGQIAYAETTGDKDQELNLMVVFTGHEIDGFEEIYFDDKLVMKLSSETIDVVTHVPEVGHWEASTNPEGGEATWVVDVAAHDITTTTTIAANTIRAPYAGKVTITLYDGTQTAADPYMVAHSHGGWTADHKLLGCSYAFIQFVYDESVYPAGLPTVKAVIRGKKILDTRTGVIAWSDNPAMCIRDFNFTPKDFGGMGCDADEINEAKYITAANICDEMVASLIPLDASGNPVTPGVKSASNPVTTSLEKRYTLNGSIKLDGVPTGIVKQMLTACAGDAIYSEGSWKLYAGAPSASVATIDESWLNGSISFQTGSNKNDKNNVVKGTFTNSNDYWADTEFPEVPTGISTPPNADYWTLVSTPAQYTGAACNAGTYVSFASKIYIATGAVPANNPPPSSSYWALIEMHDNSLQYPSGHTVQRAGSLYISTGIVPIANPYLAEDGGEVLTASYNLAFTTGSSEAQRLAKIGLEKSRRGFAMNYPCNHKAFKLAPMDTVTVVNSIMGMSRDFRVVGWDFSMMGGTNLSLVEYDSTVWDLGTSTPLVPPDISNLPDPWTVAQPTRLLLNVRVYDSNAGALSRVDLVVQWYSNQAQGTAYQVQFSVADATSAEYGIWRDTGKTSEEILIVPSLAAGNYNVRVRALNSLGAKSDWLTGTVAIPNPDTTVPNVTGFELFGQGNDTAFVGKDIKLRWNKVTPRENTAADGEAAPAKYPGWFRHYELKVLSGTTLLRTEYLQSETYNYDYERNYVDTTGVPVRNVTFEVRCISTWGESSAVAARLTATNAAPAAPTGITLTSFIKSFSANVPPSAEIDVVELRMYASQTPGFTPSESNLINKGPETSFLYNVLTGGNWYFKAVYVDSFGPDALVYSEQYSINVATLDPLDTVPPANPTWNTATTGLETSSTGVQSAYILLSWNLTEPADFKHYNVQYCKSSDTGFDTAEQITTSNKSCKLSNLICGQTYKFRIQAVDKNNNVSAWVDYGALVAASDTTAPAVVTGLAAASAFKTVFLSWTANTEADLLEYVVQIATNNSFTIGLVTFRCAVNSLTYQGTNGVTYYARVTAKDRSGNIPSTGGPASDGWSAIVSTTPGAVAPADIDFFASGASNTFFVPIIKEAVSSVWTAHSPTAPAIAWGAHTVIYKSKVFSVNAGSTTSTYVNADLSGASGTISYTGSASQAAGADNFTMAKNTAGALEVVWQSQANMVIGSAYIMDGAIVNAKIGALAVDTANIAALAVSTAKIANLAVTDAKIDSLTATKITSGSISTAVIDVGDGKIIIDGTNSALAIVNNAGTHNTVQLGKLATGKYGLLINNSTGTQVLRVDEDGAVLQNLTAGTINASLVTISNLNADNITAGTITGRTLQTAATGERFVVSSSDNLAHFWGNRGDGTIEEIVTIGAATGSGDRRGVYAQLSYGPINKLNTFPFAYGAIEGGNSGTGTGACGVLGTSDTLPAVAGYGQSGTGVLACSASGYSIEAMNGIEWGVLGTDNKGPLRLGPSRSSSAPTHVAGKGTLWVTYNGILYINTDSNTTWSKVGAQ